MLPVLKRYGISSVVSNPPVFPAHFYSLCDGRAQYFVSLHNTYEVGNAYFRQNRESTTPSKAITTHIQKMNPTKQTLLKKEVDGKYSDITSRTSPIVTNSEAAR